MKRTKLFIAAVIIAFSAQAQKVALHTSNGVQVFKGLSALISAYNASQHGDTIYLAGGSFNTPSQFNKKLMLVGAGHYVDSTLPTGKTSIIGTLILNDSADGSYIEGVEFTGNLSFTYNAPIKNITIKRCKINGGADITGDMTKPSENIAFLGNVIIGAINLTNAQNVLVSNNILQTGVEGTDGNVIQNNIFTAQFGNGYYENIRGNNNNIYNNIILACGTYGVVSGGNIGNKFKNNLFTCASPGYGTTPTVISNYTSVRQDTIFVAQSGNSFNYAHNYHLISPSVYVGTTADQIGIYGGMFPYKEGAVPSNPHIQSKNIAPKTDGSGNLNIQIKVEAQDY